MGEASNKLLRLDAPIHALQQLLHRYKTNSRRSSLITKCLAHGVSGLQLKHGPRVMKESFQKNNKGLEKSNKFNKIKSHDVNNIYVSNTSQIRLINF